MFQEGLERLQSRVEDRYYAKGLTFAQDLGEVIHAGIITAPDEPVQTEPHFDISEHSTNKSQFTDIRERRKLGKRILKAIQPQLETALRVESEISNKPFETLQKELEAKIESSIDIAKAVASRDREADGLGTIMVDASPSTEIRVRAPALRNHFEAANEDAMDTDDPMSGNIEVNTSGLGIVNGGAAVDVEMTDDADLTAQLTKRVEDSQTPPNSNGYGPSPKRGNHRGPPTPPQSNGSFGKDADPLADGGILWFFKPCEPEGLTILEESEPPETSSRMLSEDLTDLDDDELKALGAEVDANLSAAAAEDSEMTVEVATAATPRSKAKATASVKKRRTSARRR